MKFGPIPIDSAEGAVLAHATTAGERRFRKAHRLSADDLSLLKAAGISEVVAAVLAPDDLGEDAAAQKIAESMAHRNIEARPAATGRVNLHAQAAGIFTVDAAMIDAINAVDPTITIATLAQHAPVEKGQMVATVKIIPFAVASGLVDAVRTICAGGEIFAVNAYQAGACRRHPDGSARHQGERARQDVARHRSAPGALGRQADGGAPHAA